MPERGLLPERAGDRIAGIQFVDPVLVADEPEAPFPRAQLLDLDRTPGQDGPPATGRVIDPETLVRYSADIERVPDPGSLGRLQAGRCGQDGKRHFVAGEARRRIGDDDLVAAVRRIMHRGEPLSVFRGGRVVIAAAVRQAADGLCVRPESLRQRLAILSGHQRLLASRREVHHPDDGGSGQFPARIPDLFAPVEPPCRVTQVGGGGGEGTQGGNGPVR